MKKILLVLCILSIPVILFGQWVDTGGSTWTATNIDVDWEIKEIQNDTHDRGINSVRVTVSTMPQVDVTGSTVTVENVENIYNQLKTSVTVADVRYTNKAGEGTVGRLLISGNITVAHDITNYSFYTEGGNATITEATYLTGTLYIREGIPIDTPLEMPWDNPTFAATFSYGTTLYYDISGGE